MDTMTQALTALSLDKAIVDVRAEFHRATEKHPNYTRNADRRVNIITEEVGELAQAVLDATRPGYDPSEADIDHIYEEACQVAAMAIRFMAAMRAEGYEYGAR